MGDFDGVENHGPKAERLPTLAAGEYLLEVTDNKVIPVEQGRGKGLLRAFKVKEAIGEGASPVGTEVKAKLIYLNDKWAQARTAEYVYGLTNAPKVDAKLCEEIFGPANPVKGKLIGARVYTTKSDAGTDYLRYDWRYVASDD